MKSTRYLFAGSLLNTFCIVLGVASTAAAQHYKQTNLVSDTPTKAPIIDSNLVNPWGIVHGPTSPWWVADNGTGVATLYDGTGKPFPPTGPLVVTLPPPRGGAPPTSPTGIVFNGTANFAIAPGHPAVFIFVTEDGTILGWTPATLKNGHLIVDNSAHAVYKGVTTATHGDKTYLFVANFRGGTVDVFDSKFEKVSLKPGAFTDPSLPSDFAPFNVQNINDRIYVTFAKQNAEKHDNLDGPGLGYVEVFDTAGNFVQKLETGPWMNAPWAVVLAPPDFGKFSNHILVGQFGSGQIAAFDYSTGRFKGLLLNLHDHPITIDGLWGLNFGNNGPAGPSQNLYFAAGINGEKNGLFGEIVAIP